MLNIATLLEDSARRYPEKKSFIFMDNAVSYAAMNAAANKIANGLRSLGIQPGDKVALSCLNIPYFPMAYYGILKAGAVVVPLSVLLKSDEVEYHLSDSESKAYICFEGTADLPMGNEGYDGFSKVDTCKDFILIPAKPGGESPYDGSTTLAAIMAGEDVKNNTVQTGAEDTAVIIYTSGTTGKPKGAQLTHNNLVMNAVLSTGIVGTQPSDTQLVVLPLFHIFAMTVLMNSGVYKGATNILLPRFDAHTVMDLMEKHDVTVFAGVPTMYWGLLNCDDSNNDLKKIASKLHTCVSGGAALPVQVLEDFEAKFNVPILEGYGMSEGSPVVTFNHRERGRKPGSVGTPVWGVEVRLVDEYGNDVPVGEKGELIYRGHNVMTGYYKRPEANAKSLKDGWLYSGDVAVKDEDGFYFIVDRTKDMINRGGLNVYPREVEEVMMKHEAVSMVAVIGVSDNKLGEEVKAHVVLKEGKSVSNEELMAWTKEHIAAYKYPRLIEFNDALPTSATGKILKRELRK